MNEPVTITAAQGTCFLGTPQTKVRYSDGTFNIIRDSHQQALREWLNAEEDRRQQEAALPKYNIEGELGAEPPFISLFTFNRDGAVRFEWGTFSLYATGGDALEAAEAEKARLEARDRQRAGLPAVPA